MANWPTLPDDPTSLPDLSDGPPNLATAEAVANIPRRFLRKASLWLGNLTRGGGIGDGMCVAQDTPNLTVKVAAIDSFYSLASPAIALTKTSGAPFTSPAATAPATNPYIALLTVDSGGTLAWNYGAEAATPSRPAIPANKWPLWYAYLRPGSTAIRDTDSGSGGYLNGAGGAGDARYGKVAPFGGAGSGYVTVQDEGTARTARTVLNFTGAGVTATDDAGGGRTTVNIPGATGSYATGSVTLSAGDITNTSTTFIDLTGASITITTAGGPVLLIFQAAAFHSAVSGRCSFDFAVDGTRQAAAAAFGLLQVLSPATTVESSGPSMVWLTAPLAAGSHTFKVQWRVSAATGTLRADGTNFRAYFTAKELPG